MQGNFHQQNSIGAASGAGLGAQTGVVPSNPPVMDACNALESEIACLRDEVAMLVGRIQPVTSPMLASEKKAAGQSPVSCELEGVIRSNTAKVSEMAEVLRTVRQALAI